MNTEYLSQKPMRAEVLESCLVIGEYQFARYAPEKEKPLLPSILDRLYSRWETREVTIAEIEQVMQAWQDGSLKRTILGKFCRFDSDTDTNTLKTICSGALNLLEMDRVVDGQILVEEARVRLLRALAYVLKEADAIPDSQSGGFRDDIREMRASYPIL